MRFNKVIQVSVSSEDYGEIPAVARNISSGGMQIETAAPLPLGSHVQVHFRLSDDAAGLVARAEVKNHYSFNYSEGGRLCWSRGMGVRFLEFTDEADGVLRSSLRRLGTLH
jgi:hypothetical protein